MALLTCARCGQQTAKLDKCGYCTKMVCNACVKSSKRIGKTRDLYICKDCWGKMRARKPFKAER